jgi:hypothetical protein
MMSVFETCENTFFWLCAQPAPLTVHGRRFPDLPDRAIPLHQLRVRLSSTRISPTTRAVVWAYVVRQARTRGPRQAAWTVGASGLALPELSRVVNALARGFRGDLDDLEAAALGGFLSELRRVDLDNLADHMLRWRLLMAAYRAARALRDTRNHHNLTPSTPARVNHPAPSRGVGEDGNGGGDEVQAAGVTRGSTAHEDSQAQTTFAAVDGQVRR